MSLEDLRHYMFAGFAGGALCGASIVCGVAVGIGAAVTAYVVANGKQSTAEGALWAGGTGAVGGAVAAKMGGSPYAMQLKSTLRMKFRLWKVDRKLQGIKRDIYE
ncbi:hypothetical protein ACIF9R_27750 [Streptomyces sp. NPDC086080]|uniref:hypothetical protein n=1 Tax=Streptomyces sp. NPDC086080 TaxID=3365748 RepID=UPI0037CFFCD7